MVKIEDTELGKEITISHKNYLTKVKLSTIVGTLLFSYIVITFVKPILLLLVAQGYVLFLLWVQYYFFRKSNILVEKLVISKNHIVLKNIRSDKKILFYKEIPLKEIEKIFFKDTLGAHFSSRGPQQNSSLEKRRFLKIKTRSQEIFSFGFLINMK